MASAINSMVAIRELIFMYSEAALKNEAEYLRLWRMAYRGLLQMGLNNFFTEKETELFLNGNNTVTLPPDCLSYTSVERYNTSEERVPLIYNRNMTSLAGSTTYGSRYDYKVFLEERYILLSPQYPDGKIYLRYTASPEANSDYEIPVQFTEAMIDFLSWQDLKHRPSTSHFNRGDKMDRAAAFKASYRLARKNYEPYRLQQY